PRRTNLDVAGAGPLHPFEYGRQPAAIGVVGEDLAAILHACRQRESLPARAGTEIEDLLAGTGAGQQRAKLAALVLDLDAAALEGFLRLHIRMAAGAGDGGDAQPDRRMRRRNDPGMAELAQRLFAVPLQQVDAEV